MQTKLGRFNSETLQVSAKSPSSSRVTNWLIRGNKLIRALPFRNGLENKMESGGILDIAKYLLSNTTGHAELDNCEINDFVAFTELIIHAFQNLNNHEAFFKGNITSSNSRHIVKLKETGKR